MHINYHIYINKKGRTYKGNCTKFLCDFYSFASDLFKPFMKIMALRQTSQLHTNEQLFVFRLLSFESSFFPLPSMGDFTEGLPGYINYRRHFKGVGTCVNIFIHIDTCYYIYNKKIKILCFFHLLLRCSPILNDLFQVKGWSQ